MESSSKWVSSHPTRICVNWILSSVNKLHVLPFWCLLAQESVQKGKGQKCFDKRNIRIQVLLYPQPFWIHDQTRRVRTTDYFLLATAIWWWQAERFFEQYICGKVLKSGVRLLHFYLEYNLLNRHVSSTPENRFRGIGRMYRDQNTNKAWKKLPSSREEHTILKHILSYYCPCSNHPNCMFWLIAVLQLSDLLSPLVLQLTKTPLNRTSSHHQKKERKRKNFALNFSSSFLSFDGE